MDANFFLFGLYLIPIIGAFYVFYGISRLNGAEWTWNFERIVRWYQGDIDRADWERWHHIAGFFTIFVGGVFLLFGLCVTCPAALSMR
jgi:hypothetical protein